MFVLGYRAMLVLEISDDEWIVIRDSRTKSEYARFTKGKHEDHIAFEAPKSVEIRRIKKDETAR